MKSLSPEQLAIATRINALQLAGHDALAAVLFAILKRNIKSNTQ